MFEDICDDQEWVGFGVKDDEGGKTMNYPGSKRAGESGVTMWGGIWIHRYLWQYPKSALCYSVFLSIKSFVCPFYHLAVK